MTAISLISIIRKNFKLLTPHIVWVSGLLSVDENRISASAIVKKLKSFKFQHLGMATLKTFMRGHLCISGLPLESPMCSFTLPDISFILFS